MRCSSLKAHFEIKELSLLFLVEEADRPVRNLRLKSATNSVQCTLLRQNRIAFLTSESEIPNSRAIRAGVTPALNAAFSWH